MQLHDMNINMKLRSRYKSLMFHFMKNISPLIVVMWIFTFSNIATCSAFKPLFGPMEIVEVSQTHSLWKHRSIQQWKLFSVALFHGLRTQFRAIIGFYGIINCSNSLRMKNSIHSEMRRKLKKWENNFKKFHCLLNHKSFKSMNLLLTLILRGF